MLDSFDLTEQEVISQASIVSTITRFCTTPQHSIREDKILEFNQSFIAFLNLHLLNLKDILPPHTFKTLIFHLRNLSESDINITLYEHTFEQIELILKYLFDESLDTGEMIQRGQRNNRPVQRSKFSDINL